MADDKSRMRIIDHPEIVATYANICIAVSTDGSAISLTLGEQRLVPEHHQQTPSTSGPVPAVHVVSRVALSHAAAVDLVNNLTMVLNALAARASQPPPHPAKQPN